MNTSKNKYNVKHKVISCSTPKIDRTRAYSLDSSLLNDLAIQKKASPIVSRNHVLLPGFHEFNSASLLEYSIPNFKVSEQTTEIQLLKGLAPIKLNPDQPLSILLIEDSILFQKMMINFVLLPVLKPLIDSDRSVILTLISHDSQVEAHAKVPFHIILSDFHLGARTKTGFEITKGLLKKEENMNTIFISISSENPETHEGLKMYIEHLHGWHQKSDSLDRLKLFLFNFLYEKSELLKPSISKKMRLSL